MSKYYEQLKDSRWQKRRLEILQSAGFKCDNPDCKSHPNSQLHIHHSYYEKDKDLWDYSESELKALCETCHKNRTAVERALLRVFNGYSEMEVGLFLENLFFRPDFLSGKDLLKAVQSFPPSDFEFEFGGGI